MKRKLKELRRDLAAFKTAWQQLRKTSKDGAKIKEARQQYEACLAIVEAADADGKKDADEIDVPKSYKSPKPAAGKAAGEGEGEGEGEGDDDAGEGEGDDDTDKGEKGAGEGEGVIEREELKSMIAEAVGEELKPMIEAFDLKGITEEKIESIVDACLKKNRVDSKMPSKSMLRSILKESVDEAMKQGKKPGKMLHGGKDGRRPGGGDRTGLDAEQPYSLCKGNLPLHMKQLFNIVADGFNRHILGEKKFELIEISPDEMADGKALGEEFWGRLRSVGTKALTTTGTGTGAEWVPRDLASEVWRRLYLESALAQQMLAREVEMPSDPWDMPMLLTRPKFYRNNVQNREARASTPGTGKFTLATQKCMALVQYSYEVNEDSIIAMLPMLQRLLGEAAAESLESMFINGDSAATHMDADITDPDDINKTWDGFRKLALASSALKVDMSTGGIVRANLLSIKRQLGKWGRRPSDLAWITGGLVENQFLGLDEVITADKRGSVGTTLTGVINSYLGSPIIVSEVSREDLNAAGVYDGVTMTKGSLLLVNLAQFVVGNRRDFMIETDRNIKSQTIDIVASFRKAFKPAETPGALSRTLAIGYNFNA
jgi:hypothetical protein